MAWYDEAVFYHIYPLGMAGAPEKNDYGAPVHRLNNLIPWIQHIKDIGCNAVYIGPLFESVGHGYETTDYKKLDSRLGDNEDLKNYVAKCHEAGIKVIFDGVFNHTGRDFFAFKDIKEKREHSQYCGWYCNVNFYGNNEYNDGFSYENWGGYNLLVKLNQKNPAVKDYICDVVRFWVKEFDVDGIRLDAADVLDFDFMKTLRGIANAVKPEFWLMGEVIHGDYSRWVNEGTLHSVTNYHLHKAFYSGHNDHNYFEIAHTVKRLNDLGGNNPNGFRLYNFVDNHDVERIYTKLANKAHFVPVHVLLYTLPGIPSIYYGSEFGIDGKKEKFSDASLRPALSYDNYKNALCDNAFTKLIAALGKARQGSKALCYGNYKELLLRNRQYAFSRTCDSECVIAAVNNDESSYNMTLPVTGGYAEYVSALSGQRVSVVNSNICITVDANSGDIWMPLTEGNACEKIDEQPAELNAADTAPDKTPEPVQPAAAPVQPETPVQPANAEAPAAQAKAETPAPQEKADAPQPQAPKNAPPVNMAQEGTASNEPSEDFKKGQICGLQEAILAIMSKKGPVTDQMRRDVLNNVYHDSLINWVKSFN